MVAQDPALLQHLLDQVVELRQRLGGEIAYERHQLLPFALPAVQAEPGFHRHVRSFARSEPLNLRAPH